MAETIRADLILLDCSLQKMNGLESSSG